MDYKLLFLEVKEKLAQSNATIDREETEPAITDGEREYYENEEEFSMSDDLFELLKTLNGLEFRWSIVNDGNNFSGFFNMSHVEELAENKTENSLWVDWYNEEDIDETKKHRIFERFHGSDNYITIKIEEDKTYALYYVPEGSVNFGGSKELDKIPLTIEEYVRIVMGYFGVYSIRHHLHKVDFYKDPKKYIPEYDLLVKFIPGFEPPLIPQGLIKKINL